MLDLSELFEVVQGECATSVWSRGVALARAATIDVEPGDDDEVVFRVCIPTVVLAPTVRLFPEDEDYLCDCSPKEDVCEHVVAALVAHKHGNASQEASSDEPAATGAVGYRFMRSNGGVKLERVIVAGDTELPLRGSAAAASNRSVGPALAVRGRDIEVERVLGHRRVDWLAPAQMKSLLKILLGHRDVQLDGQPIETSVRPLGFVATITDEADGFLVSVGRDPSVTESFNNQVGLCGSRLHPLGESGLSGRELETLTRGRLFRGPEVSELVTRVLPSLRTRLSLNVQTNKLPGTVRAIPRLVLDVVRDGHELTVLPTLVYGDPAIARIDGDTMVLLGDSVPMRDDVEEARLLRKLSHRLEMATGHKARFSGEQAVAAAERISLFDADVSGHALDSFFVAPPLVANVSMDGDDVNVSFSSPNTGVASSDVVLSAWRAGASMAPLDDGGWASLPSDWLSQFGPIVADLLAAKALAEGLPPSAVGDVVRLCEALDRPVPPRFETLKAQLEAFDAIEPAALPTDLTATLRHYQQEGVNWLGFLRNAGLGGVLADDMGLGKTLQALCAVDGRTLVVCPTSVLHNWAKESARFRPNLRVSVYHGPGRKLDPNADITLTSYAILRLDIEVLAKQKWNSVILDEAQNIKNPDSQVAKAAYRIDANFRLTLTGTPVENRLDELWSQLHFTNPGLLGGRRDFSERYAKPISEGKPGRAELLRQRLRPFILRRLKRDVAPELPKRTDLELRCELTQQERRIYDSVRAATRQDVVARLSQGGNVLKALEALLRLRQAACHCALLPGQGEVESSSKVTLLVNTLDSTVAQSHKALVFSQWTGLLDKVEPELEALGIPFDRLDGSTKDRGAVVDRFQSEDGPPVLLLSLKAGGTGLNLTAADHVFLMDPWWNPAAEDQAADRAHRIGQENPVFVHRLVANDTVEERILALQQEKRALVDAALSGADAAGSITRDDLLMLLGD